MPLTTGSKVTDRRLVNILHLLLSHEQMKLLARALAALEDPDELHCVVRDILKIMPLEDLEMLHAAYHADEVIPDRGAP